MKSSSVRCFMTAISFLAAVLLAACSILPKPLVSKTTYYDLGLPEKTYESKHGEVLIEAFISSCGERYRMAVRENNIITGDELNKWILPPGSLLTKYLRLSFTRNMETEAARSQPITVGGIVTAFELDRNTKEAVLGIRYRIIFPKRGKEEKNTVMVRSFLIREKVAALEPKEFSEAMTRAAAQAAERMAKDISSK